MKLQFNNDKEQVELIKAMASTNRDEAIKAQEAFAALIQPVVQKVLDQEATTSMIFNDLPYDEDDSPSIPLDLYYQNPVGTLTVWSQNYAGGVPTNQVAGMQELKIATFRLDGAVSMYKRYARRSRLDVVAAAINRLKQEVLVKLERNGWAVVLAALGQAVTNGTKHTIATTTQNVLQLDDFNRIITLSKRINQSFANGTPTSEGFGATDFFLSPEMMEQIRAFAYQPMNTRNGKVGGGSDTSTSVPLPDSIRERIFNAQGASEIFSKTLHELRELGTTQKYNVLFGAYAAAGIANGGGNFSTSTDEIIVGADLSANAFHSPIARNAENGSTFTLQPDDSFNTRSEKMGFFGAVERGFVVTDSRALVGIVA